MGAPLRITGLSKSFGTTKVLQQIDLDVQGGKFVSLLGPSGCGKSTLLRIVAGFTAQDDGSVTLGGHSIDHIPPSRRNLAMVFQNYALYPHMTVAENISLGLEIRQLTMFQRFPVIGKLLPEHRKRVASIQHEVQKVAETVEISHLLKRRPSELSGGQRQRVALARAIIRAPEIFLMDEPLSNLDAKLRVSMRAELVTLNKRLGATILYVTHDQNEAMAMSDSIALMMNGKIIQYGTPKEMYNAPLHLEVAKFIGQPSINCLDARSDAALFVEEADGLNVTTAIRERRMTMAIRPEALLPRSSSSPQAAISIPVTVDRVELLGPEVLLWATSKRTGRTLVAQIRAVDYSNLIDSGVMAGNLWLEALGSGLHIFDGCGDAVSFHRPRAVGPKTSLVAV